MTDDDKKIVYVSDDEAMAQCTEATARHIALVTELSYEQSKHLLERLSKHIDRIVVIGGQRSSTARMIGLVRSASLIGISAMEDGFRAAAQTMATSTELPKIPIINAVEFQLHTDRKARRHGHKHSKEKPFWVKKWEKNRR